MLECTVQFICAYQLYKNNALVCIKRTWYLLILVVPNCYTTEFFRSVMVHQKVHAIATKQPKFAQMSQKFAFANNAHILSNQDIPIYLVLETVVVQYSYLTSGAWVWPTSRSLRLKFALQYSNTTRAAQSLSKYPDGSYGIFGDPLRASCDPSDFL